MNLYIPVVMERDTSTYLAKALVETGGVPDFFSGLTPQERDRTIELGVVRTFGAGSTVFEQGEAHNGIMIIRRGEVRSYYSSPTGREITLAYWKPGHFVGGPEVFGSGLHTWSGEAVHASELLMLPGGALRQLALEIPQIALNVIENVVFKAKCFSTLVQMLGTQPVNQLLARLLLIIARDQVHGTDGRVLLDMRYTQEELAKLVGATRQWVASTIARMRRSGIVSIVEGRICIEDIEALMRIADE